MYKCERCGGTFSHFNTPGQCPLCGIHASVRCSSCGHIADANVFVQHHDMCPMCGARVAVPGASAGGGGPGGVSRAAAAVGALFVIVLIAGYLMARRGASPPPERGGAPTAPTELATAIPTLDTVKAVDGRAAALPAVDKQTYSAPVDQGLRPGKAYFAIVDTAKGQIELQLWPDLAPQHVNSMVFLAREGFFDGLTFHRVVPGFVVQGGDPSGSGQGGPGYSLPAEFNADNPVPHRMGTLAMARTSEPDSAGSQFYIVLEDGPQVSSLDGQYTVFGHVTKGMDVVKQIAVGDTMAQVAIEERDASASVVTPDDIRTGTLPANN